MEEAFFCFYFNGLCDAFPGAFRDELTNINIYSKIQNGTHKSPRRFFNIEGNMEMSRWTTLVVSFVGGGDLGLAAWKVTHDAMVGVWVGVGVFALFAALVSAFRAIISEATDEITRYISHLEG